EFFDLPWTNDQSTLVTDIGKHAYLRSGNQGPRCGGLSEDEPLPFVKGRVKKYIRLLVIARQLFVWNCADELYGIFNTKFPAQRLEPPGIVIRTDDDQLRGHNARNAMKHTKHHVLTLDRCEVSHVKKPDHLVSKNLRAERKL